MHSHLVTRLGAGLGASVILAFLSIGAPTRVAAEEPRLTATYTGEVVHLYLKGSFAQYTVKRGFAGAALDVLEFNETGCTSQCTYDDLAITFGADYEYAIEVLNRDGTIQTFGPVPLSISKGAGLDLQSRAFPNPMERGTTIRFIIPATIAQTGTVRSGVTLHDPAGRIIRDLWGAEVGVGEHLVEWDGRDGAGRDAPGGVYFYRIQADSHAEAGRIILLR